MNAKLSLNYLPLSPGLWISGCLVFFAKTYVKNPSPLLKDLFEELNHEQELARYFQCYLQDLPQHLQKLDRDLLEIPAAIRQWIASADISREEIFAIYLIAELDNRYELNLLLQELQIGQQDNQLSMHLLSDLLAGIFACDITPARIAQWTCVKQGLVKIHQQGPLVLAGLQLDSELWRLLNSAEDALQSVTAIATPIQASSLGLKSVLEPLAIAIRLGEYSAVKLIADQYSANQFASALAQLLNMTAVIPPIDWKNRFVELGLLASAYNWLLVLDENVWPSAVKNLISNQPCMLVYSSSQSQPQDSNLLNSHYQELNRASFYYQLPQNSFDARVACWQEFVSADQAINFASRWLIDPSRIAALMRVIRQYPDNSMGLAEQIAATRLAAAPANLLDLAFHISMSGDLNSVILHKRLKNDLQLLSQRCLQREKVFSGLGGNLGYHPSAGVKALFSGESGTGKTLAATLLAHQLGIPLYRLDLGSILNKYVGETEKNIHKLLQLIADEDYILLIDEADALFGKRTDAESGGERFANMLTNYLLARIEQHQGIVFMTTNGLGRIDPAFMRRFDQVIEFQPPEFDERVAIWKSLLGERNPGDHYCRQLASLCELSGGFIRNAVLSAAAEVSYHQQKLIPYASLVNALSREYRKSGKPVPPKLMQHLSQQNPVKDLSPDLKEAML